MSTQLFHFFGILGRPARDVEAACRRILSRRRVPKSPPPFEAVWSDQWTARDRDRIDSVCQKLLARPRRLPVMHYSLFLDGYAMGGHLLSAVGDPHGPPERAYSANYGFALYSGDKADVWRKEIRKIHRASRGRRIGSATWYADHLRVAIDWTECWKHEFVVIAVSECVGGSRMDADLHASAAGRFDWDATDEPVVRMLASGACWVPKR